MGTFGNYKIRNIMDARKNEIKDYIQLLSDEEAMSGQDETIIHKELLSIDDIKNDNILQIIPNKKGNKLEKESFTLLSIKT